ncbi:hypothetical protein PR202_gb16429 [Eleusine coracana subsp. coracana]|uniref:Uncharacterized protein n=1 Tax=Eleusine coracana subsp. coracana TaxID=191504 RepID=A0AAV5F1Y1_ELECO|nr:hypothetical protein QOZ80_9BG0698310 [Eleusine coracana subsp. coracana]GJN28320.1 hypothetical protein PR202_gb16429 [Eleusine coracana subsp. coracana]
MRKLSVPRGGGEKLGVLAFEVAALMSRAASLWRALGDDAGPLARLHHHHGGEELLRLEGVRRLVSDDEAALVSLALAETAGACACLARAVARLASRCADPLLRRFDPLFAALVDGGADRHGVRYRDARKMDRKARKMQRLVALTACLCHETDVLAELQQQQRVVTASSSFSTRRRRGGGGGREAQAAAPARRVERQRQEVDRLRAASLWGRTFDYAVRLLARSLFTIVARVIEVFDLEPAATNFSDSIDSSSSKVSSRISSWSGSFVGPSVQSMSTVYPSDDVSEPRQAVRMQRARSGKLVAAGGDARRFLMSRSRSLKQQLINWPGAAGKHLIGCVVVTGSSRSPSTTTGGGAGGDLPLSFSYVSASPVSTDEFYSGINLQSFQADHHRHRNPRLRTTTSVFDVSCHDVLRNAPETTLGGAALALHYAHLIIFIDRLAVAPHHICADERDELYGMLTDTIRSSLRARLRPLLAKTNNNMVVRAAEWADTVRETLGWLAPLAHNMVRWQAERNFEQRSNVASGGGGVLLLQTLHFADRRKTEAAVTEVLVGLDYLWRSGRELEAKNARVESRRVSGNYEDCKDYLP